MDNTIIFLPIYYLGIASCAAQGAEKGKSDIAIPIPRYIANAFGGGFMRDVIFLGVHPWLFSLSALPELMFVITIGLLYTYCFFIRNIGGKYYSVITRLVTITDAFGLGSFVYMGMDKAFDYSNNILIIILCGYSTAIGGGILAKGKPLIESFNSKKKILYHFVVLLGCCYNYMFKRFLCLVCFIVIGLFLVNTGFNFCFENFLVPCYRACSLYQVISNKNFHRQSMSNITKKYDLHPKCSKLYLMQRRIRQC